MCAVTRAFAVALALVVLLPAPVSDAAEGWSAVGIEVREGRRPAAGVEVRLRPETASTAEPGARVTGVTDEAGRAVLYLRPGVWRLELSTGERVDYFVTVRVVPGRRAEELGSPARDVDAPDLRWRYFKVDEPPPLELLPPIRPRGEPTTERAADDPAATPASAEGPATPVDDEPAAAAAPPAEPDSVVPPPAAPAPGEEEVSRDPSAPAAAPPADPVTEEPPAMPSPPTGPAADEDPTDPTDEPADPTPSDSSPFGTLPRPASPYDPPSPAVPEPAEEAEEDVAPPVPVEPVQPPATVPPADEEEPEPSEPPTAAAERPPGDETAQDVPTPAVPAPPTPPVEEPPVEEPPVEEPPVEELPLEEPVMEEPAVEEGAADEAVEPPLAEPAPGPAPVAESPPELPLDPLPAPAPVVPPAAEPVEPELPPAPPRFTVRAAGECPDCRDAEATVVVERTVSPGGGVCGPEIAVAALDAARRLGGAIGEPRSLEAGPVARWTAGDGCQLLGVVLPAGVRYRGYRYEVEGGDAAGRCYAGSECPVAGAIWPDRPVIRPLEGGETLVYGLFRNTSGDRARRARLTVYYLP